MTEIEQNVGGIFQNGMNKEQKMPIPNLSIGTSVQVLEEKQGKHKNREY